jgi:hypothetical protein
VNLVTLQLVGLLFMMVITRPREERAWRSGRITDRQAAWLIVGRLPAMAFGFGLIIGRSPIEIAALTGVGLVLAFILEPVAQRRLATVRAQGRGGPPAG